MLGLKFSAQYSPNYGRCEHIKIAKTLFDVSKQVFLTPAVMVLTFRVKVDDYQLPGPI